MYIIRLNNQCLMLAWREDGEFVGIGTWGEIPDLMEILDAL